MRVSRRSHARITSIDTTDAAASPGVLGVFTLLGIVLLASATPGGTLDVLSWRSLSSDVPPGETTLAAFLLIVAGLAAYAHHRFGPEGLDVRHRRVAVVPPIRQHHRWQWQGRRRQALAGRRQQRRAGEKLFIDYAGDTMPIVDAATGAWMAMVSFTNA